MTRLLAGLATTAWTATAVITAGLGYHEAAAAVLLLGAAGILVAVVGRPPTEPDGLEYEGATPEWADQLAEIGADIRSVLAREEHYRLHHSTADYLRTITRLKGEVDRKDDLIAELRKQLKAALGVSDGQ